MANNSQKYWEEDICNISDDEDPGDLIAQEEAEAIFRAECRLWLEQNQSKLLGSPFAGAYKKPWTKKSSSTDSSQKITTETGGRKKANK